MVAGQCQLGFALAKGFVGVLTWNVDETTERVDLIERGC